VSPLDDPGVHLVAGSPVLSQGGTKALTYIEDAGVGGLILL